MSELGHDWSRDRKRGWNDYIIYISSLLKKEEEKKEEEDAIQPRFQSRDRT